MKVRFPAPDTFGAALILAAVLALAGYLLFPLLSHRFGGAMLFAAGVAAGASSVVRHVAAEFADALGP